MPRHLAVFFWGATALACTAQGPWEQCGGINWTGGTTCVDGWTCIEQNPYYSQCLEVPSTLAGSAAATIQVSSSLTTASTRTTGARTKSATPSTTGSTATAKSTSSALAPSRALPTPSSSSSSSIISGLTSPAATGLTYKASFTHYGAGDSFGSPNCQTDTAACGFFTSPGFAAAVSQNLFGVGPGAGAGPACGTCWQLTGETDSSGNALTNAGTSIIVMVNNLCPASGNPLCAQTGLAGTNQYGANVNFDLCSDSGAEAAFFGNDEVGLAIGTASQVDCSRYSGTVVH